MEPAYMDTEQRLQLICTCFLEYQLLDMHVQLQGRLVRKLNAAKFLLQAHAVLA